MSGSKFFIKSLRLDIKDSFFKHRAGEVDLLRFLDFFKEEEEDGLPLTALCDGVDHLLSGVTDLVEPLEPLSRPTNRPLLLKASDSGS